jgi:hypothetical protein
VMFEKRRHLEVIFASEVVSWGGGYL